MLLKIKQTFLFLGDIALLFGALAITLLIRYNISLFSTVWNDHLVPFSIIFVVWILTFYLADLYRNRSFTISAYLIQTFFIALSINLAISITAFYLFGDFFKLTPKINLLLFSVIFGTLGLLWRILLGALSTTAGFVSNVLIIGDSQAINELKSYLLENKQIGYHIAHHLLTSPESSNVRGALTKIINENHIDTIVAQTHIKRDAAVIGAMYRILPLQIQIVDLVVFYELIFQKIPLKELDEGWFLEKILLHRRIYDALKRVSDIVLSFLLGTIFLIPAIIIVPLIKITSKGPALFSQKRMGKNEVPFTLYKFRTMEYENSGALWTDPNDKRITKLGKVLRYMHLDEIPQIINIFLGNISFVGPRPERIELAAHFRQLPYYEIRHIIKPGLTGWAQVNYHPSASLEEAQEKLQYDMYYIKNRSLALDFLIILKTAKTFLFNHN